MVTMERLMQVQFWGTRGSIATPGPETVRYGGNTSCVSVRTRRGTQLVIDAGTGLRGLGIALMQQGDAARRGHLLIGHTHWDHIQGFPFFTPLFEAGNEWDVYAPRGFGPSLRDTLAGQMQYTYFPVNLDEMGATIRYHVTWVCTGNCTANGGDLGLVDAQAGTSTLRVLQRQTVVVS